ncbi:MAG TPA: hypothetical protein VE978_21425 [Chitinophagales bacterium]|nr:hypothetical protein [Chitinophagales bacterium]
MLKRYPRIDAIVQKARAEAGVRLLAAAGAFVILIWVLKTVCEWLNLSV